MDSYIATGDPYDKAGGYAKQHPLLSPLVTSIEGDPFTVTGLPFALLGRMLSRHGIHVPRTNQQIAKLYYQTDLSSQNIIQ